MTDTLSGEDGWGPPRPKQHLPTPKPRAHPPDPKRPRRPLGPGRAHGASYSTKGGGPRKTDAERGWTWPSWEAPLALHLSPQGPRLRGLARAGQPESFPRRSPPEPPRSPRGGGRPPPGRSVGVQPRAGATSHDGAAVAAQRALEAQGGVHVLAAGAANALEQLAEEQQDVPVVLGRALHVAALPGLAHQV